MEGLEARRLLNAADLDDTFGIDGRYLATDALQDVASAVKRQTDGKLVVAGASITNVAALDFAFLVQRFNEDGTLDTGFGTGGQVNTEFTPGGDLASDVLIQPDGKIVAVGVANGLNALSNSSFALARYNADGTLDDGFGTGGLVTSDLSTRADAISAAVLQSDGRIVVVGQSFEAAGPGRFTVARYLTDGTLDASFGTGGVVRTMFVFTADFVSSASAVAIDADGKIVAAGTMQTSNVSSSENYAVARYDPDGSLDATFDGDGRQTINFENASDRASAIAIQSDGKILVAGEASGFTTRPHFGAARLNPNGSLDPTWAGDGTLRQPLDAGGNRSSVVAALVQSDGRVVLAGYQNPASGSNVDFALARFTETGELDPTFGAGGVRTLDFGTSNDQIGDAILLPGERILAAGTRSTAATYDTAIARFKGGVDFASVTGGTLAVVGTAGDDTIDIAASGADLVVTRNGVTNTLPLAGVNTLNVLALAGNDSVRVGVVRPGAISLGAGDDGVTLTSGGGVGVQQLIIDAAAGADTLNVPANVGVPVTFNGGTTQPNLINFTGSDGVDQMDVSNGSLLVGSGDSVLFTNVQSLDIDVRGGDDVITWHNDRPASVHLGDGDDVITFNRGTFFSVVTLSGGAGDDRVVASAENGSANVTFDAGEGNDTLVYNGRAFGDTIGFSRTEVAGLPVVRFSALEALVVNGNGDDDDISGSVAPDGPAVEINGGAGNDGITLEFAAAGSRATVAGGDGSDRLNFAGTGDADVITLREDSIQINGDAVPYAAIESVSLNGAAGNDTIVVHPGGLNLPALEVDGGGPFGAADLLRLTGGDGPDDFTLVNNSRITHGAKIIGLTGVSAIELDAGAGADTIDVRGTIPVRFPLGQDLASLSLAAGARVVLTSEATLQTDALAIAAGGTLDLGSGSLIVGNGDIRAIEALMKNARDGATRWHGAGIGTSMAGPYTGLCAAESAGGGVAVKYTYNGDSNLDGRINSDDYFQIDSAFLAGLPEPLCRQGDYNFDDRINSDDYFLIDSAFLGQGTPLAAAAAKASAPLASNVEGTKAMKRAPQAGVWTENVQTRRRASARKGR